MSFDETNFTKWGVIGYSESAQQFHLLGTSREEVVNSIENIPRDETQMSYNNPISAFESAAEHFRSDQLIKTKNIIIYLSSGYTRNPPSIDSLVSEDISTISIGLGQQVQTV